MPKSIIKHQSPSSCAPPAGSCEIVALSSCLLSLKHGTHLNSKRDGRRRHSLPEPVVTWNQRMQRQQLQEHMRASQMPYTGYSRKDELQRGREELRKSNSDGVKKSK